MHDLKKPVLVTGATGYVGGRLVRVLLDRGFKVRVMGRSLKKLWDRPWISEPGLETAEADVMEEGGLGGILYWYSLYPFHQWIFKGLLKRMTGAAGCEVENGPERMAPRRRT